MNKVQSLQCFIVVNQTFTLNLAAWCHAKFANFFFQTHGALTQWNMGMKLRVQVMIKPYCFKFSDVSGYELTIKCLSCGPNTIPVSFGSAPRNDLHWKNLPNAMLACGCDVPAKCMPDPVSNIANLLKRS